MTDAERQELAEWYDDQVQIFSAHIADYRRQEQAARDVGDESTAILKRRLRLDAASQRRQYRADAAQLRAGLSEKPPVGKRSRNRTRGGLSVPPRLL